MDIQKNYSVKGKKVRFTSKSPIIGDEFHPPINSL
jgi:hypothetical protein